MRKIYSIVLTACTLLLSTSLFAAKTVTTAAELQQAINDGETNIVIGNAITVDATPIKVFADPAKEITIDLAGNQITTSTAKYIFWIFKGNVIIKTSVKDGKISSSTKNGVAIQMEGQGNPAVSNWSNLTIREGVEVVASGKDGSKAAGNAVVIDGTIDAEQYTYMEESVLTDATTMTTCQYDENTKVVLNYDVERTSYSAGAGYTKSGSKYDIAKSDNGTNYTITGYPNRFPMYRKFTGSTKVYKKNGESYTKDGLTWYQKYTGTSFALAYGVNVIIEGKLNATKYGIKINGLVRKATGYSEDNLPYVQVASTGEVLALPNSQNSIAIYSAGYGKFDIKGYVHGASGIYIKSGKVNVTDARVESDATVAYKQPQGKTSGVDACGSAIVVESNASYNGDQALQISGDSKISSTKGYAVEEIITTSKKGKVDNITVDGGTFVAGEKGTIVVTLGTYTGTDGRLEIKGGNLQKDGEGNLVLVDNGETLTPADPDMLVSTGYTTTTVKNDAGKDVVVVIKTDNDITDAASIKDATVPAISWTGLSETLKASKELEILQMNAGTDAEHMQILTIGEENNPVTLKAGHIIMNAYAQIVIMPGSSLIITEAQGIVATSNNNLMIKTAEGNPAQFLFSPKTTSNRHPNATVEFFSKSKVNGNNLVFQRFGIPTYGKPSLITAEYNNNPVQTAFYKYDYEKNAWPKTTEFFGAIHWDGQTMDYDQMKTPFEYYQMLNNNSEMGTIVKIQGNLVGNSNEALAVRGDSWNGFANSYMGKIDGKQLIELIPETVDKAFYLYDITQNQATWEAKTLLEIGAIDPMQPFLIRNTKSAANVSVDYTKAIYNPALGISNEPTAPVRRVASDMTRAKLVLRGEDCIDRVTVAESDMFTAEFDNGYDAAKYMNDGINMYVSADEKMSIYATDNLENTYVGVASVKGGTYSISFEKVAGESLTLIDHETGATVDMTEGNVYEFTVAANTVNDYRFQIVGRAQVATDVENISAANNGAVYTIMGQYVGQMSEWNNLPAGIYVVDGVKRVK
jgi:hypothetical protein